MCPQTLETHADHLRTLLGKAIQIFEKSNKSKDRTARSSYKLAAILSRLGSEGEAIKVRNKAMGIKEQFTGQKGDPSDPQESYDSLVVYVHRSLLAFYRSRTLAS